MTIVMRHSNSWHEKNIYSIDGIQGFLWQEIVFNDSKTKSSELKPVILQFKY